MEENTKKMVAVIGAGPAGLFAARELANHGAHVVLFNRDIKPGGLAEYGIYPDKIKMKEGLRAQFRMTLALPNIDYYGNVSVGRNGLLTLDDLRVLGFQAILIAAGAQGTKWTGIPGEDLPGVYHAKDLVYYYNQLPPYSERPIRIGQRVVVVGAGNVMADISHYLIYEKRVERVTALARRGPLEVKFDKKELENIVAALDEADLQHEVERVMPDLRAVGQDPSPFWELIHNAQLKAANTGSPTQFQLHFLGSIARILGDETHGVQAVEVEDNRLVLENEEIKARGSGQCQRMEVDTVIFAIGDRVDEGLGLPVKGGEFVKNPDPAFPVDGQSYEAFDPHSGQPIRDIFMAGWARKASTGLVGVAHRDGANGAKAILQYLETLPGLEELPMDAVRQRLAAISSPLVDKAALARLEAAERQRAAESGLPCCKFSTNGEMLEIIERG
jgi:ferredoxin--NADP+ reductase